MRTTLILLLAVLSAAGCARKKPPPLVVLPQTARGPGEKGATGPAALRPANPANPMYQGRSPPQWAEQLQSKNHAERSRASMALAGMGEAGYPHLRDGMRSPTVEVRLACLQVIGKLIFYVHRDETLPLLTGLLRDPEPAIRRVAASKLCWLGAEARSALPALQEVAEKDEEPDIRQVARLSIEIIEHPNGRPNPKEN